MSVDILIASIAGGKMDLDDDFETDLCYIPPDKCWDDDIDVEPCFSLKGEVNIQHLELAFGDEKLLLY